MKRLEDIERMEAEELEAAAVEQDAAVPKGLQERLEASLLASSVKEESRRKRFPIWIPITAVAVAAALSVVLILPHTGNEPKGNEAVELKDSFDDPYLAYAQVEATFKMISSKMAIGADAANKAYATAGKPKMIMNKINKK